MRTRVLFADAYPAEVAGAQRTLAELATRLGATFDVSVATVGEGAASRYWRSLGLTVHVVPYPRSLRRWHGELTRQGWVRRARTASATLRHARSCAALLRAERVDVLYCSNLRTVLTFGLGARLARVPSIWYVQQLQGSAPRAHAIAARIVTRVAPMSPRVERVFPAGLPAERSVVIPLGLDLDRWSVTRAEPSAPPPLRLVYVGQIHPEKGIGTVILALAELRRMGVVATLRVVGSAADQAGRSEAERLTRCAREIGVADAIDWFGQSDDVAQALAATHVLVLGSRREGVPRSVMEAMALGMPAVVTDVGAVRDLVLDGVTGWLVAPDDPGEMARALARYGTRPDLVAVHGAAARAHVLAGFDLDRTVAMFATELSALGGRS